MKVALTCLYLFCLCAMTACSQPLGIGLDADNDLLHYQKASLSEEEKIETELGRIESMAHNLGYEGDFHQLPIYVSTESEASYIGRCHMDDRGRGKVIAIHQSAFNLEFQNPRQHYIFLILLHEIGHCYFHRGHESELIQEPGVRFAVELTDSVGGEEIFFNSFPPSVMYVENEHQGNPMIGATNLALEEYYVAELLGKAKITSIEQLMQLPGLQIFRDPTITATSGKFSLAP